MTELKVRIWRGGESGAFREYAAPLRENQTVLDVLAEVRRRCAPDLAYRYACRVGVCGSCAMTVNGAPRWACRTHIRKAAADGRLEIAPLRNLPRVKDLVCDMSGFFEKWRRAGGVFSGTRTRRDPPATVRPSSPERRQADAGIECINCGICHAACDVAGWDSDYLGPAALNRAWTLLNDVRHAGRVDILRTAGGDGGCHSCRSQGNCARFCPTGLNPSRSIAGLKRAAALDLLSGIFPAAGGR